MGHSTVMVTERYAHLLPDMFGAADRARVAVDLSTPTGKILPLAAPAETQAESKIGAFGLHRRYAEGGQPKDWDPSS